MLCWVLAESLVYMYMYVCMHIVHVHVCGRDHNVHINTIVTTYITLIMQLGSSVSVTVGLSMI